MSVVNLFFKILIILDCNVIVHKYRVLVGETTLLPYVVASTKQTKCSTMLSSPLFFSWLSTLT